MGYNVVLELDPEQKQRLKLTATKTGQTVRGFVTAMVVKAIDIYETKPEKSTKRQNKNKEVMN